MTTNYQDFQAGGSSNELPTIYLSDSVVVGGTVITSTSIVSISISNLAYPSGSSALPAGGQTITLTGNYFESGVTLTVGGSPVVVTRVSNTSATFTSPAKNVGTYTVTMTNPDGTSASTTILYAVGLPGAPTIGTATATGTTTATVAFTAPADNGGSTITSYTATSIPGNITGTLSQAGSGTITVSGLSEGTSYIFTVTATNIAGTGPASASSNSITTFATPVNTVAPVVSGTANFGQTLSTTDGTWTGTATITYTYQWQRSGTNISSATSSTYTLVQADVGNTIRCVVTGTNSYGNSSANSNSTASVSAIAPGAPTIGTATTVSKTSATVTFTAPASNGGATITTYTATSSPGNITGTVSQSGSGTITVTGLTAGTNYTFTVTATNSAGTSSASSASNQITTTVVPGAPTIGTATVVSGTSATVSFTAPADDGGATITTYTATSSPGNVTGTLSQAGSGTITVTGLTPGTNYTFTVTATNSVGTSAASAASNQITTVTVPGAPTIGTATATSGTTATVAFTAPASDGGATITTYTATSSPGGITGTLSQAGSGTITVTGLSASTTYTFTVTATNSAGTGAASASSNSITTPLAGNIWSWGINSFGQLGIGNNIGVLNPTQNVANTTNWSQVYSGEGSTGGVKTDNTLWMWGRNNYGQLGDNTITNRNSPIQTVSGTTNWTQVSTGGMQSGGIKTDGTLWIWGRNNFGQLGNNTLTNVSSPIQTVSGGTNWRQLSLGRNQSAAIKTDGTLWTWGRNNYGQLGDNTRIDVSSPIQTVAGGTNWKQVSNSSAGTIMAVKTDGTLWGWGINNSGGLGNNNTSQISSPVQTVSGGTNWSQVSAGYYFSAAVKTDGTLWTWGRNSYGQLGDETRIDKSSPIQTVAGTTTWTQVSAGRDMIAGIKTDNTLWTWGRNNYGSGGALGDGTTINRSSPVQTTQSGLTWKQVSAGNGQHGFGAMRMSAIAL